MDDVVAFDLREGSFQYSHRITDKPSNDQHHAYLLETYEIFYFVSGDVIYQVEGQTYRLEPGDLLILNNREMHRPYFESEAVYERIILFFHPDICRHYCSSEIDLLQLFERRKPGLCNRVPGELAGRERIFDFFREMEEWNNSGVTHKSLMIELIFIRLLVFLHDLSTSHPKDFELHHGRHERLEQIIQYINQNLNQNLTLEKIARTFHMNKYYFSHLFHKITGMPYKQYLVQKRLAKAIELLNLSVPPTEAARLTGFDDYSNFYKAFRKLTGVSPSHYKDRT